MPLVAVLPPVADVVLHVAVLPLAVVVLPITVVMPPVAVLPRAVVVPPVVLSPVAVSVPRVAVIVPRRRTARCRRCAAHRPADPYCRTRSWGPGYIVGYII